ncbi:hypothetical protein TSUD_208170 [Trifolium subterraneum]|uniref:Uncharacterized protein n=1 Tax=Trifolium subterraneum TaxID=3900 RepID=A0A2Z6P0T4_TRISU|nr:hypothetical protein TSUD_208170 [Trifolium subterraneum]
MLGSVAKCFKESDLNAANDPLLSLSLAPPAAAQEETDVSDPAVALSRVPPTADEEDTAANDQSIALSLARLAAEVQQDLDTSLSLSLKQPTDEASISFKKRKHE